MTKKELQAAVEYLNRDMRLHGVKGYSIDEGKLEAALEAESEPTVKVVWKTYYSVEFRRIENELEDGLIDIDDVISCAMSGLRGEPREEESVCVQVFDEGEEVYTNV